MAWSDGWLKLTKTTRRHFFLTGVSICGKWQIRNAEEIAKLSRPDGQLKCSKCEKELSKIESDIKNGF